MVERRRRADAHELLRADLDHGRADVIVKMRNDVLGHCGSPWRGMSVMGLRSPLIPAQAGIQLFSHSLGARFRGDEQRRLSPCRVYFTSATGASPASRSIVPRR